MLKTTVPGLVAAFVGSTAGFLTVYLLLPDVTIAALVGLVGGLFGADVVWERKEAKPEMGEAKLAGGPGYPGMVFCFTSPANGGIGEII